ncbi:MFS transporter [Streptomyces filamentosus]|uniref:MFS transporter n=1 Tax=Streptomyces filamentosus TaxID=67294 RepID=UPI0033289390
MTAPAGVPLPVRAGRGTLALYASGSVGMGVWVTVPGLLLLYFLTDVLGVPASLAGLTLLLPKVVDVVVHPLLGSRSDREARRTGHRRRMMRAGVLLGVAMVALFSVPPALDGVSAALWVGCWFTVGNLLFAGFQVPYLTTPSDLRVGYHERTRVFMFRMVLLTLGLLGAGVAAPALVAAGGRGDYALMALVLASVTAVSAGVALVGVRRLTDACGFRVPDERAGHAVLADLRVAWRDRDYRALVLSYLFTGTTTHLFLAALPYVTAYVFDDTRLTALFMGLFLAPALFASPLWTAWSRRFGKQRGLLLSQGVFAAGSLALLAGALLGGTAGVAVAAVVVMLMGVAFAGLQLFAFSMVPDAVAAAGAAGSSKAGAYTGVWTATEATGTAIGPYLYSAVLALGGFVSRTAAEPVAQSGTALGALLVGFTVVPAVLMAVALGFQRRYTLDPAA